MGHFDEIAEAKRQNSQYELLLRSAIKAEIIDGKLAERFAEGDRRWPSIKGYITATMALAASLDPDDFTMLSHDFSYLAFYRGMGVEAFTAQILGNALDPAKGRRGSTNICFRAGNILPRFEKVEEDFVLGMANAIKWLGHAKLVCLATHGDRLFRSENIRFLQTISELPVLVLYTGKSREKMGEAFGYKYYDLRKDSFADVLKRVKMLSERVRNQRKAILIHVTTDESRQLSEEIRSKLLKMSDADYNALRDHIDYEVDSGIEQAAFIPGPPETSVIEDIHRSIARSEQVQKWR